MRLFVPPNIGCIFTLRVLTRVRTRTRPAQVCIGGVGGTRKNHTHRCVSSFYYLAERKVRKTTKIIVRVFNTCKSSPILVFFVPETLNPIFLENTKRRAPENDRDLSYQNLIWSHMMPFGVNSDPSFRAQKRRMRDRVSSFRIFQETRI